MTATLLRRSLPQLLALALLALACQPLLGQDKSAKPSLQQADRALLQKLLQRVETLEAELKKLRKDGKTVIPADPKQQRIVVLIETPFLGTAYYRSTGQRYFAAKLVLVNLTDKPRVLKTSDFRLAVDGKPFQMPAELPSNIRSASFQIGNQSFRLSSLQRAAELSLPPGGSGSTWVVFPELPGPPQVPRLELSLGAGAPKTVVDINASARSRLTMESRRIGPRDSLGLVSIAGTLDTINLASLVDQLDTLAAAGVVRTVIRFTEKAPPIDSRILSWLQQAAAQAGRGVTTSQSPFPRIPVAIRELHLAAIPNQRSNSGRGSRTNMVSQMRTIGMVPNGPLGNTQRVHNTTEQAIAAALATAFRVLPKPELLREIQTGDPLIRPAAMASGGGRLGTEQLPVILSLTNDNSPAMAQASLVALRHFGEPAAVARLVDAARKNQPPFAAVAIDSLAASRYPAAHQALLKLLESIKPKSRKLVVMTLARHPRPAFSEAIYRFANDPDPDVGLTAMRALAGVGHPKLMEVLSEALQSTHPARRDMALSILSGRTDRASEKLAMTHVLKRLETAPPDAKMMQFLTRTRDPRAIPSLLKHLAGSPANRSSIINALLQVGDQTVTAKLLQHYPKLPNNERAQILTALVRVDMRAFRKLAGPALTTNDSTLVNAACRGLQQDASPRAVAMLIKAFETSRSTSTWNYVANALSGVGTPAAREALEKARRSNDRNKRTYAANALRNIHQRSPGYQYVSMGRHHSQQLDWKQALAQFDLAIKIDPRLPAAFAGRGNARMQLGQEIAKVRADFQKAVELDPLNSQAMTGMAIVLLREGKLDAGLKYAEDSRKRFVVTNSSSRRMYAYNLACVYSRAIEIVKKDEKIPKRDMRLALYRKRAFEELNKAAKAGYRDTKWLQKDPDLAAIRDMPEFKKLIGADAKKKKPQPTRPKALQKAIRAVKPGG